MLEGILQNVVTRHLEQLKKYSLGNSETLLEGLDITLCWAAENQSIDQLDNSLSKEIWWPENMDAASYRLYSFGHTHSRFMSRHREQVGLQRMSVSQPMNEHVKIREAVSIIRHDERESSLIPFFIAL